MTSLTRPAAAALALCLSTVLLATAPADAGQRSDAMRLAADRQTTIDSFYDRWLRNNLVPVGWTGNADTCDPGTTSPVSEAATIDQINYYRELVGSPPAALDQTYAAMPQRAALMMHANGTLNHFPPPTWRCYQEPFDHNLLTTVPAAEGIESYMHDTGANNLAVGHRRALIDPRNTGYATGSTDGYNAVLITARDAAGTTSTGWVAWPPAGLVASPLVPARWSIDTTSPGLDLTNAWATVTGPAGALMPPVVHRTSRGIVFEVPGDLTPPVGVDVSYQVTISGMTTNGVAAPDHTYVTTLVRPDRPTVAGDAPTVSGDTSVGGTLTATPGTWLTPGTFGDSAGWTRDGQPIRSTSGQLTYDLRKGDLGHQIRYTEVGQAEYYLPTTVSSAPVVVTASADDDTTDARTLKLVRKPRVRGKARVGKVITAVAGRWRPTARSSYRWLRGGKVVGKGTRLRLTRAYAGKKVVLKVTAKRRGYPPSVVRVKVGRVRR